VTSSATGAGIGVGVRSHVGAPGSPDEIVTVGVLVDSAVVAFPVDPGYDFRPTEVEVVVATLPLAAGGTVERIPATRVDILAVEGLLPGSKVAFGTLSRPCTLLHDLPTTSQPELLAAIQQTGELWSAVAGVSGWSAEALVELPDDVVRPPDDVVRPVDRDGSADTPSQSAVAPVVQTRTASSVDQLAIDWCMLTPRCAPPPD
jgi:hypothetical protein